jgi:hypothetical protein
MILDNPTRNGKNSGHRSGRGFYSACTIKRTRRTKAEIQNIRDAIHAMLVDSHPMTCRQVFYRATVNHIVEKTEREYNQTIIRLLLEMRLAGDIPFPWISDNTRWIRKPITHSCIQAALENTVQTYRRDLWLNQDVYVEVWTEKDALAGVLLEETRKWDVPLMVSRGCQALVSSTQAP